MHAFILCIIHAGAYAHMHTHKHTHKQSNIMNTFKYHLNITYH